jgi:hypothetical protein
MLLIAWDSFAEEVKKILMNRRIAARGCHWLASVDRSVCCQELPKDFLTTRSNQRLHHLRLSNAQHYFARTGHAVKRLQLPCVDRRA